MLSRIMAAVVVLAVSCAAQLPIIREEAGLNSANCLGADDFDGDGFAEYMVYAGTNYGNGNYLVTELRSGRTGVSLLDLTTVIAPGYNPTTYPAAGLFASVSDRLDDMDGDGLGEYCWGNMIYSGGHLRDRVQGVANPQSPLLLVYTPSTIGAVVPTVIGDLDFDGKAEFLAAHAVQTNPNPAVPWQALYAVRSGATGDILYIHGVTATPNLDFPGIAALGDVDSDGVPDFVVDLGSSGLAIFSGALATALGQGTTAAPSAAILAIPSVPGLPFQRSLIGLGDVDGDGVGDFGHSRWNLVGFTNGVITDVRSGSNGSIIHTVTTSLLASGTPSLAPEVRAVGDLNGDGVRDFYVSRPGANAPTLSSGHFAVYSGAAGQLLHEMAGPSQFSFMGFKASAGSDVNGDGLGDIVVSQNGSTTATRRVFIVGVAGATRYGTPAAVAPLDLSWHAGSGSTPAAGIMSVEGGTSFGSGVIGASLGRTNTTLGTLSLFIETVTTPYVAAPIAFDSTGRWTQSVNVLVPGLDDLKLYLQAAETAPSLRESNGLQLLFTR